MNKRKKSIVGMLVLLAVLAYLSYVAVGQQKILDAKKIEMTRIEAKIREEEEINEALKREHEMIDSEEYKEKIAREKLGMVKKNERVFFDIGQ
jgi:cell division protein FtsB